MNVIARTKAVTLEIKHTHTKYSVCLLRPVVMRVLCCSVCLFIYRAFFHGALKLDLSTLFTAVVSLNITSIFIILY